jgi:hypothetical protein
MKQILNQELLSLILSQTGNDINRKTKILKQNIGKYIVTIELSLDDKYIKIIEIEEDKQYLDLEKKKIVSKYLDVSEFYED